MIMYDVNDVVNWFLSNSPHYVKITNKKLQKLLYYAYCWYLVYNNHSGDITLRLFENDFQAWVHGPVYPSVYYTYSKYTWNEIPKKKIVNRVRFSDDDIDIFNRVIDNYGKYNGNQLEQLSTQEYPWVKAREGLGPYDISTKKLSDTDIFKYYIDKYL